MRARALLLAFAILVPLSQQQIDAAFGPHRAQREVLYLWSGESVRRLFPGLENVMADIYWLRTVQYFGAERVWGGARFDLLEPLVNITVSLDPRFEIVYRYGATFLSEPWPIGAGKPEAGVRLLEQGVRNLPRAWLIRQNLGFFLYLHLGDAKRASEVLMEASRLPGAPVWLETMAADMLSRGGERETARRLWRRLYDQAEDARLKRNARTHLDHLDALDLIEGLEQRMQELERQTGRRPRRLAELVEAGLLRHVPTDPAGVAFNYDQAAGKVWISRRSPLWRPMPRSR